MVIEGDRVSVLAPSLSGTSRSVVDPQGNCV